MPDSGSTLGNYRILRKIGAGANSEVFEAQDEKLGRKVALRVLSQAASRDETLVDRFRKAAQRIAALNHGSIIPILQIDEVGGRTFCAMPLVATGNLRDHMARGIDRNQILNIARGVAEALGFAHGQGLIHRDLKPENILVNEQGDALVGDFGLSRALRRDPDASATSVMESDPHYTSPEEARGQALDERTDIYALGVILHEVMSGKPPFDGAEPLGLMFKHVTEPIPPLPAEYADMQALIERMMAKEPDVRYANAAELLAALRNPKSVASAPAPTRDTDGSASTQSEARKSMSELMAEARRRVEAEQREHRGEPAPAKARKVAGSPKAAGKAAGKAAEQAATKVSAARRGGSGRLVGVLSALAAAAIVLVVAVVLLGREPAAPTASVTRTVATPPTTAAPFEISAQERQARIESESQRCTVHVSQLTDAGNLLYEDLFSMDGAQRLPGTDAVRMPPVTTADGRQLVFDVTPNGCARVAR